MSSSIRSEERGTTYQSQEITVPSTELDQPLMAGNSSIESVVDKDGASSFLVGSITSSR